MMQAVARFLIPTTGPDSWRALLAEPDKHWKPGRSAWLLAHRWESAEGFPDEIGSALASSDAAALQGMEFLIGLPEWKTPLPGGSRPSQTDLLVLARNGTGSLVIIGVEGKVDEPFGPTVNEWEAEATPGRLTRLAFLCDRLGIDAESAGELRYQLLHRTVAAMLEAERFDADAAVMLVHSFDLERTGHDDYRRFLGACGAESSGELSRIGSSSTFCGWVAGSAPS
jgi:hypothetical protein